MAVLVIATMMSLCVSRIAADFSHTLTLPEYVQECFDRSKNLAQVDRKLAEEACLRAHFNKILTPLITDEDYNYFKTEFEDTRYGFHGPPTGFRRRSDIRTLSRQDREAVFDVFRTLYENGVLGRFGRVHGQNIPLKHRGRAFLPWHRMLVVAFEEEMRKINPDVSLPYWDYTMDYYIPSPDQSVVWSHCFFGNGDGPISSGPFAGWFGGYNIEIQRHIANADSRCPPRLINKDDIKGLMDFCHYQDITTGTEKYFSKPFNLEVLHDGVHDWLGGDLGVVKYSAFDPVFWMHHAFIDYIWELFRHNQQSHCNIDPETDYPTTNLAQNNHPGHGPNDPMPAFEYLKNINGMWNNWTTDFYSYEPQPECPECGNSIYLFCDKSIDRIRFPNGICVSKQVSDCKEGHISHKRKTLQRETCNRRSSLVSKTTVVTGITQLRTTDTS
ncbi:putative tyrosinase-like protein tyr-3 [Mya arenaria]|uniref:putative tyrosinase-like protein tyr-3 n=1 Tax=Mya arenaria TaxID=6604 RepID=UPI0022E71497|nr:putative tyrosinase-like protein tyr-3 [Mya arenaria]